eukprot:TRINITY_DN8867_c0_g1_i7.p1 TRINITY_DN8867_c0_g1~~TRINITY_DN8867_c0_g1_i7.p1  ORF type:complete len:468 (+),score=38.42 TRINITY_DN8867_c0_g1_i7:109-1512(+)
MDLCVVGKLAIHHVVRQPTLDRSAEPPPFLESLEDMIEADNDSAFSHEREQVRNSHREELPPEAVEPPRKLCAGSSLVAAVKHSIRRAVVKRFVEVPSPRALFFGLFPHYIGMAANSGTLITAIINNRWVLTFVTLGVLIIPGLMHAINMFFVSSIVKPDMPVHEKRREALLSSLNLNRIVEVRSYRAGSEPIWSLLFKDRLGSLTLSKLPSFTINLAELLSDSVPAGFGRVFLQCNTIAQLFFASTSMYTLHTCCGPPGNMQKYRFWNVEENLFLNVIMSQAIDISQVWYRLVMLGFLGAFGGFHLMLAVVIAYSCVTAVLVRVGLSVVPAYGFRKTATVMSLITGLENVLFDYPWLEPVPVYSFYIEACFALRSLQAGICALAIFINWEVGQEWNDFAFYLFGGSGAFMAVVYFTIYPLYVFYLVGDRAMESYEKRDDFISTKLSERSSAMRICRLSSSGSSSKC